MTTRDHLDPRLGAAMEAVLADLVSEQRSGAVVTPGRRRGAVLVTAITAVVLVVATAAVLLATAPRPRPPASPTHVAPSVVVSGKALPYAGRMPWYGAVRDPADDRTLTIHADGDLLDGPASLCGLPAAERAVVTESSDAVVIEAVGYSDSLPPGSGCAGVGHGLQAITVRLQRPLGDRVVRDAVAGAPRRVLAADLLPAPGAMPPGFVQDADSPRWVDGFDMLSATWRDGAIGTKDAQTFAFRVGDGSTPRYFDPDGPPTTTTTVQGAPAPVWQDGSDLSSYWRAEIRWTTPDGLPARLQYEATSRHHLSLDAVMQVARSIAG